MCHLVGKKFRMVQEIGKKRFMGVVCGGRLDILLVKIMYDTGDSQSLLKNTLNRNNEIF